MLQKRLDRGSATSEHSDGDLRELWADLMDRDAMRSWNALWHFPDRLDDVDLVSWLRLEFHAARGAAGRGK